MFNSIVSIPLVIASLSLIEAQSLSQDCAVASNAWQKMGGQGAIPADCCKVTYGIHCSATRITAM
jgi:hypothetical protein